MNADFTQMWPGTEDVKGQGIAAKRHKTRKKKTKKISRKAAKAQRFGGPKGVGAEADER
jgi:hypothetical protein